jgi:hypothetical protein
VDQLAILEDLDHKEILVLKDHLDSLERLAQLDPQDLGVKQVQLEPMVYRDYLE